MRPVALALVVALSCGCALSRPVKVTLVAASAYEATTGALQAADVTPRPKTISEWWWDVTDGKVWPDVVLIGALVALVAHLVWDVWR